MNGINWGMAYPRQQGGSLNALAQGFQFGQQVQANRRAEEGRNALAAYAVNPTREGAVGLAAYNPQLAMGEIGRFDAQERQGQINQARIDMVNGVEGAGQRLQQLDFDTWQSLNEDQQEQIAEAADAMGQAAMRIAQLPPEQRATEWDRAAMALSDRYPSLGEMVGRYDESALNAAIEQAGLVQELWNMTRPSYQVIPQGGTMVNTRDPAAVRSVANRAPPGNIPPPPPGFVLE